RVVRNDAPPAPEAPVNQPPGDAIQTEAQKQYEDAVRRRQQEIDQKFRELDDAVNNPRPKPIDPAERQRLEQRLQDDLGRFRQRPNRPNPSWRQGGPRNNGLMSLLDSLQSRWVDVPPLTTPGGAGGRPKLGFGYDDRMPKSPAGNAPSSRITYDSSPNGNKGSPISTAPLTYDENAPKGANLRPGKTIGFDDTRPKGANLANASSSPIP